MDWNYMKKLMQPTLGVLLVLAGLVLAIYNFVIGFEISFAFLALLVLLLGALTVCYGIHKLPKNE